MKLVKNIFIIIFLGVGATNVYGCGCTDEAAADSFKELATQMYDGLDSSLSESFESLNDTLEEITELVKTEEFLLNESTKYQQVYLDKLIFENGKRKGIKSKL